jgi:hypothetical protein
MKGEHIINSLEALLSAMTQEMEAHERKAYQEIVSESERAKADAEHW